MHMCACALCVNVFTGSNFLELGNMNPIALYPSPRSTVVQATEQLLAIT